MTDTPKTLSLGPREWNALLAHNAAELAQFFQNQPTPSQEAYVQILQHIDRMKQILPGWLATAPPVPVSAVETAQKSQAEQSASPQTNGAAPKKGGWPKGKKRTRAAAAQAMQ